MSQTNKEDQENTGEQRGRIPRIVLQINSCHGMLISVFVVDVPYTGRETGYAQQDPMGSFLLCRLSCLLTTTNALPNKCIRCGDRCWQAHRDNEHAHAEEVALPRETTQRYQGESARKCQVIHSWLEVRDQLEKHERWEQPQQKLRNEN